MFKIYYLKWNQIIACNEEEDMLQDILVIRMTQHGIALANFGYPVNEELISLSKDDINIMFEITKYNPDLENGYKSAVEKLKHPEIVQPKSGLIL